MRQDQRACAQSGRLLPYKCLQSGRKLPAPCAVPDCPGGITCQHGTVPAALLLALSGLQVCSCGDQRPSHTYQFQGAGPNGTWTAEPCLVGPPDEPAGPSPCIFWTGLIWSVRQISYAPEFCTDAQFADELFDVGVLVLATAPSPELNQWYASLWRLYHGSWSEFTFWRAFSPTTSGPMNCSAPFTCRPSGNSAAPGCMYDDRLVEGIKNGQLDGTPL